MGDILYYVEGVYLGGEKSQSLIGIAPIGDPFVRVDGIRTSEVLIPEAMLTELIASTETRLLDDVGPLQQVMEAIGRTTRVMGPATGATPDGDGCRALMRELDNFSRSVINP